MSDTSPHQGGPPPPWLEAWIRDRLGPDAALGAIAFEGRLVHLRAVRVPLGRAAALEVSLASIELGAGHPLGDLPLAARLLALRGEIRVGAARLPFELAARDDDGASWVHAAVRVGGVDATLTLGPSGVSLATARSELRLDGAIRGGVVADARIVGRLDLADVLGPFSLAPEAAGVLELDLSVEGPLVDPALRGQAFAAAVELRRDGARRLRIDDASASVEISRRGLGYRELHASVGGTRLRGWGRVPFGSTTGAAAEPILALQADRLPIGAIVELAASLGVEVPLARPGAAGFPPDLEIAGEAALAADRSLSGSFALETHRSALLFRLAAAAPGAGTGERSLLGSTLRGRLAAADAIALGLFPDALHPTRTDLLHVEARLGGTLARPGITGRVTAPRLLVETALGGVAFEVADGSVLLDVGPDGLAWQALSGRLYGGSFTSSGRAARRTGALEATLAFRDVRLQDLPTSASGERALADLLRGACSGEVRFERASVAAGPLAARGALSVDNPEYLFVEPFAAQLARYGLPRLDPRGRGPLRASVRLDHGEIIVEPLALALEDIDVGGVLRVRERSRLLGRLAVELRDAYLARSPVLAIPAAFSGKVVIPIYIHGTPGALDVQTDAIELFDGLLGGTRIGDAVREAWGALRGGRRR